MTDNAKASVTRNDGAGRYEIAVGDAAPLTDDAATPTTVAGYTAFQESETHIAFTHTHLDDAFQGQGLGSPPASLALADAFRAGDMLVTSEPGQTPELTWGMALA